MTSPILALRAAIQGILTQDATLLGLLGGPQIYDETPASVTPPYVTFGEAKVEDWSAGYDHGHHHVLSLNIWSRQGGDSEALGIAHWCAGLLDGATPPLDGHRLVMMRVSGEEVGRPSKDGLRRARVFLEAYSEPLT
jgi:Protein of unknown function (DUF3168)